MIIWITGLSGSGKSTIGSKLCQHWRNYEQNTILIDGDEIRAIFKHNNKDKDYSIEGRRINAERIQQICVWLDKQGFNVVCCILSVFNDITKWNRKNFSQYYEVYIDVPMDVLLKRDIKNLYAPAYKGKIKNVVGVDIPFPKPELPDMIIDNSKKKLNFKPIISKILDAAKNKYD